MSYGTTTLNLGSGGSQMLDDTLLTIDGAPAPAGARVQINKLAFGSADRLFTITPQQGLPVYPVSPLFWRVGFAESSASGLAGLAAQELSLLKTGAGMTVSQSGGNLIVTTGTTADSETVLRSADTFRGALLARYKAILSQRIVNQTFRFELADLVGEGLAYTINSATSVTVSFPAGTNPFTAAHVGQSMRLAVLSSVGVPGRYAIASVSGDTVSFTVAGFPASGSGTLMLYGRNWLAVEYSGTTATTANFDCQRNGWASGPTAASIRTTAAPGHVGQISFDVLAAGYADSLVASNTAFQWAPCASRIENVPDEDVSLYFFVVVQNGSTAPASSTTLTVGFLQCEDQPRNKVRLSGSDPSPSHPAQVHVLNPVNSVTAIGTVGPAAEDAAATGNPVIVAGVARTGNAPTTFVAGDTVRHSMTSGGQLVVKQYAPREAEWVANLALTSTTAIALAAAAAAGIRNHLTSLFAINTGASIIETVVLDGAAERLRLPLPPGVPVPLTLPTGIPTSAATALNINLSAVGTVRIVATGYTSA